MTYRTRRRLKWMDILELRNTAKKAEQWRTQGLLTTFMIGIAVTIYLSDSASSQLGPNLSTFNGASRKLLAEANSSVAESHGPGWESCDFEKENSQYAWLFNHVIFILITFIAIAIVCDDFFVPSLEIISEKLKLSEDVAGATFMAAGSSAPELFSSVAGVAVESDVGVGTIVGSAVFNLLIIIALTAALAGQVLKIDWRPLSRDAFFYAMSIGCFIGFVWDGEFTHYEACILLILYALYILLMVFNPRLMDWMGTWRCCCDPKVEPVEDGNNTPHETQLNGPTTKLEERKEEEEEDEEQTMNVCPCLPCCPAVRTWPPSAETARSDGGCLNWFKYIFKWILFIPAFPFVCAYSWTIPNCAKEELKKWYIVSFIVSVMWIAVISFGMVTLVGRAGCILGIDSYVMGLIVVAIGTSIPDALSSVLVARDGFGDMAVANAIGSNVFDINFGLGLPFLIRIAIDKGKPISLINDQQAVDLATGKLGMIGHAKFGFILLLILVFALTIFGAARFRLNKWIGISFVCMYVLFITYALVQELVCVRRFEYYC